MTRPSAKTGIAKSTVRPSKDGVAEKLARAEEVLKATQAALGVMEKLEHLNALPVVQQYLAEAGPLKTFLAGLTPECDLVIKAVIALGQADTVFLLPDSDDKFERLRLLLQHLVATEQFYDTIGGLIGYYTQVLKILSAPQEEAVSCQYLRPQGIDIAEESAERRRAVLAAIHGMDKVAEIYPVGGAGDRLSLSDAATGEPLPAARLVYDGKSLLARLVTDLQAREYLRYKVTGDQVTTPVAVMTSKEKNNHAHILTICEEAGWFGRSKETFRFFEQPLVPVVTEDGNFSMAAPLEMNLKPGGHGVMWKLAAASGIFDWLDGCGCTKAVVKQINNPMAETDAGMLAFAGAGLLGDARFGFASCERVVNSAEGMNVVIERQKGDHVEYCLTNVEYTDFAQKGIEDVPAEEGSPFSAFPCNTNILWADLAAIAAKAKQFPIPGMLLNMKTLMPSMDAKGAVHKVHGGRLESTMQNIADHFIDRVDSSLAEGERSQLGTFLTYNTRRKTLSVTKTLHKAGDTLVGSVEGCYYDHLRNMHELLTEHCGIAAPDVPSEEDYCTRGPAWTLSFHPALGPLYSAIAGKLRQGVFHHGAELRLDVAQVDIQRIDLNGSLVVTADQVMGHFDSEGQLKYSDQVGRIRLMNVSVVNEGVDNEAMLQRSEDGVAPPYWTGDIVRKEALEIVIHGDGEFAAEGVTFRGAHRIEVPAGVRCTARQEGDTVVFEEEKVSEPSWVSYYEEGEEGELLLTRRTLC